MLKIDLEDLVINSMINVYNKDESAVIDNSIVSKYKNDLIEKLDYNGINYVLKVDSKAFNKIKESSNYIDVIEKCNRVIYKMKDGISLDSLLMTRMNLSDDLIDLLVDDDLFLDKCDKGYIKVR